MLDCPDNHLKKTVRERERERDGRIHVPLPWQVTHISTAGESLSSCADASDLNFAKAQAVRCCSNGWDPLQSIPPHPLGWSKYPVSGRDPTAPW